MEPRAQGKHGSRLKSNVNLASSSASVTTKYISGSHKYNCFSGRKQECFSDNLQIHTHIKTIIAQDI